MQDKRNLYLIMEMCSGGLSKDDIFALLCFGLGMRNQCCRLSPDINITHIWMGMPITLQFWWDEGRFASYFDIFDVH